MKKVRIKSAHPFFQILYWGSLWGITEATLGHVLHLLRVPGLAGFFMFPIGLFFMIRALKTSGKPASVPAVAAIAASLKLVDLVLPGTHLFQAVNPALAILAESLAFLLIIQIIKNPDNLLLSRNLFSITFGWRIIYGFFQISIASIFSETTGFLHLGNAAILRFLLFDSMVNFLLILGTKDLFKTAKLPRIIFRLSPRPGTALVLFASAVLTHILI